MRIALILALAAFSIPVAGAGPGDQDIFSAVRAGDLALAKALLDRDPGLAGRRDENGRTPLITAILYGRADMTDLLIRSGADVDLADAFFGKPPLLFAVEAEEPAIASRLLEAGASVPAAGDVGRRILHRAAWSGCADVLEAGAGKGAGLGSRNDNGGTLLHSVVRGRLEGWTRRLLAEGFSPDEKDRYGLTPLHLAAARGWEAGVRLLLDRGARIDAATPGGKTPYHAALDAGQAAAAELLRARGADTGAPKLPDLRGDYFGQRPPGRTAELFAPGIVSTMDWEHGGPEFSPDGSEMYWSPVAYGASRGAIRVSRRVDGRWTAPVPVPFSRPEYREMGPGLSADGSRLYFTSYRPLDPARPGERVYRIWASDRVADGWSEPRPLPAPVNVPGGQSARSTLTRGGALYFGAWGRTPTGVIFRTERRGGSWAEPELLPFNDRSPLICSYADPDDRFLVFESARPGGRGGFDLYVASRDPDGRWGAPVNLGDSVNSPANEWFASFSHDGRYLFFTSDRNGNDDVYWIDVRAVTAIPARGAAAPEIRLSLVAITVPDLEKAAEWYRRYLGFEPASEIMRGPGAEMVLLRKDGATLELLRREGSVSPASLIPGYDNPALLQGYGKAAFEVSGLDALAERMKADGVRFVLEPRAAATAAFAGCRTCIVVDNSGNWVQLLEETKGSK